MKADYCVFIILFDGLLCQSIFNEDCTWSLNTSKKEYTIVCSQPSTKNTFFDTGPFRNESLFNTSWTFNLRIIKKSYPTIPNRIFQSIKMNTILIQDCQLTDVDSQAFDNVQTVYELYLSSNRIRNLSNLLFTLSKLSYNNMTKLYLEGNRINSLVGLIFPITLRNLVYLSLDTNEISIIPRFTFQYLTSLQNLFIRRNPIVYIEPRSFESLSTLLLLDIERSTGIQSIRDDGIFFGLTKLTTLSFSAISSNTEVSNVSFFRMPNLSTLKLDSNGLQTFRVNSILDGPALKVVTLYLNQNSLTVLYDYMFLAFPNLKELDIGGNKITQIEPKAFYGLNQLGNLDISVNRFKYIQPFCFIYLGSLTWLSAGSGLLELLDNTSFIGLGKVTTLTLNRNRVRVIKSDSFSHLTSLKTSSLDFSYQDLVSLEPRAFYGLNNLVELTLELNRIERIENFTFLGLGKLDDLTLSYNLISELDDRAFQGLESLTSLELSSNRLTSLNKQVFINMPMLGYLYVARNQLKFVDPEILCQIGLRSISLVRFIFNLEYYFNLDFKKDYNPIEKLYEPSANSPILTYSIWFGKLINIHSHYFNKLTKLIVLLLRSNQISSVDWRAFSQLTMLNRLDLSSNAIFKIDRRTFINNKQLVHVNLQNNLIVQIDPATFQNLPKLSQLFLGSNRLVEFSFAHLANSSSVLTILNLALNGLLRFNSTPGSKISSSLSLFLGGNLLQTFSLDSSILRLDLNDNSYLERVNLSNKLTTLDLSNDVKLTQLSSPSDTFYKELRTLNIANVSSDLVKSLNFSRFTSLSNLNLSSDVVEIERVKILRNIRGLNLSNANLRVNFESILLLFSSVETLDLSNNMIELSLDFTPSSTASILKNLYLKSCNLNRTVNTSAMSILLTLDLSLNQIDCIRRSDLSGNTNLQTLNMSFNQIRFVESGSFAYNIYLFNIDLSNNQLLQLSEAYTLTQNLMFYSNNNPGFTIDAFYSTYLTDLELIGCNLTKIPKFASSRLFHLFLSNNKIKLIENSSFALQLQLF